MSEHMRYEDASDRIITVANAMTALRPPLAALSVYYLHKEKYVKAGVAAAAAALSDKEGTVGRWIEDRWPGWGISKAGITGDPLADSAAVAVFGIGALFHKRVHPVAKGGLAVVMSQEAKKGKWALETTKDYQERTGERGIPVVPVTETGKRATFAKLTACVGAIATAMLKEDSKVRDVVAYATLGTGVVGAALGEQALVELKEEYAEIVAGYGSDTLTTTGSVE